MLREWLTETVEGATWGLRFDELLLALGRAEKEGGGNGKGEDLARARVALMVHVEKALWRRGERL